MVLANKWVIRKHFEGNPVKTDLEMVCEDICDSLDDGEVLVEAVYLTVDPYMKIWPMELGSVLIGEQVAKVIASRNAEFSVNSYIFGKLGWRSHSLVSDVSQMKKVPDIGDLPLSAILGVMGMPGMTAYFGVMDSCDPKPGETFVVNSAAGAVGSIAGQIAKLKGSTVIAFAGNSEKCKWLKDDLGFDAVFNYKETEVTDALKKAAPNGVDCFFDNVGGSMSHKIFEHMNLCGKIAICGDIMIKIYLVCKHRIVADSALGTYNNAHYSGGYFSSTGVHYKFLRHPELNKPNSPVGTYPLVSLWNKRLQLQGVSGWGCADRWPQAQSDMLQWIKQGSVKYRETVTHGFENMADAFIGLFKGSSTGKAIIKI